MHHQVQNNINFVSEKTNEATGMVFHLNQASGYGQMYPHYHSRGFLGEHIPFDLMNPSGFSEIRSKREDSSAIQLLRDFSTFDMPMSQIFFVNASIIWSLF